MKKERLLDYTGFGLRLTDYFNSSIFLNRILWSNTIEKILLTKQSTVHHEYTKQDFIYI